jgi:hypothetical protein
VEAISHARKYLTLNPESQKDEVNQVAGLLVFTQDSRSEKYKVSNTNLPRRDLFG